MGAVLARAQFTSELGREWEVEIFDLNELGSPTIIDFEVAAPGFTLQYESPNDDLLEPIKASKCSTEMIINVGDTSLETLITDIAQADDGQYFIIISEDKTGTGTYTPYWWGPILTDLVKEPDAYPTLIKLVATDGLGRLKEIDYVDGSGDPTSGQKDFSAIVAEILELSGNGSDIVGTDYVKVSTIWRHDYAANTYDNFLVTAVRAENYWVRDDDTGNLKAGNCYDILKSILLDWNARIFMNNGYYWIEQATGYDRASRRETIIDTAGDRVSQATVDPLKLVGTDVTALAGGKREWTKPIIEANRIYEHRYNASILPPQPDYWEAINSVNFPYTGEALQIGGTNSKKLVIDGRIELVITNRTGSDYSWSTNQAEVALLVRISNGTTTYYLDKPVWASESSASWSTSSGARYFAPIPMGKLLDGEQFRTVFSFNIMTPGWTETDMIGTAFYVSYGPSPAIYLTPNAIGNSIVSEVKADWTDDPFSATYSGDTVLQGQTLFMFAALEGGDNDSANEKLFTATNTSGSTNNVYDYSQNALIGSQVKSQIEPGLIRVTQNLSTYKRDGGEWAYDATGGLLLFNELAVQEVLAMYKVPRERIYRTIFGEMDFHNSLYYNLKRYAITGGKFIANNDRWQGVWEEVDRTTTGITLSGDTLPNTGGLTGGSTSPTLPSAGGVAAGLASALSQGSITSGIPKSTTITGITVGAFFKSGVIGSGDQITVISASSGQSQTFTTTAKVDSGDTTISVSSATTNFDISPGDLIVLSAQQQASQVNAVEFGDWTPGITVGGGSVTIGLGGQARYYKFQNIVMVSARIPIGTVLLTTGALNVTGLPYSTEAFNVYSGHAHLISSTIGDDIYVARMQASANTVQILKSDNTNAADQLSNGCTLFVQIQYLTT